MLVLPTLLVALVDANDCGCWLCLLSLHGIGDDVDRITLVLRNREQLLIAMLGTVFASVCYLYSNIACTHSDSL